MQTSPDSVTEQYSECVLPEYGRRTLVFATNYLETYYRYYFSFIKQTSDHCIYMCIGMYACMCVCVCMDVCIYACMCMDVCMYVCMDVCIYACMCIYAYIYIYLFRGDHGIETMTTEALRSKDS